MLFKEAISKRIYELCEINNISPNKLSELSTVPHATLFDMLYRKVQNPSSYILYRLCVALNMTLKDFFDSDLFNNLDD